MRSEIQEAARAVNRHPTKEQKEAGNYAKGHFAWNGLGFTIETPKGTARKGIDHRGKRWSNISPAHYGYLKKTEGADGEHVDAYMGPDPKSDKVFVFDQIDPRNNQFDEHKVVLGALSRSDATSLYDRGFSDHSGPKRRGAVTEMTVAQFKRWLERGNTKSAVRYRRAAGGRVGYADGGAPDDSDATPPSPADDATPALAASESAVNKLSQQADAVSAPKASASGGTDDWAAPAATHGADDWIAPQTTGDSARPSRLVIGPYNNDANPRTDFDQEELRAAKAPTPNGPGNPLVGDSLARSGSFFDNLRASLAPGVQDQIKHFSKSMGIPENRFGVIDGNIVYADENGHYQRVTPSVFGGKNLGEDFERLGRYVASGTGSALPQAGAAAVGTAMGPTGLSIPAAAGTAAAIDTARQAVSNELLGRGPFEGTDWENVAGQAAEAGAGQGAGALVSKVLSVPKNPLGLLPSERATALNPGTLSDIQDIMAEARTRGIHLSFGQASQLRSALVNERQLGRDPVTMDQVFDFFRNQQNAEVPTAVRDFVSTTVSPKTGDEAIGAFRNAATDVMQNAKEARNATGNTYDQAFKANQSVSSPEIDSVLKSPAGKVALNRAATTMQNDGSLVAVPDPEKTAALREAVELGKAEPSPGGVASGLKLRTLDYVRHELWNMSQEGRDPMTGSYTPNGAAILGQWKRLTLALDAADATAKAGPNSMKAAGGLYAKARAEYAQGAQALQEVANGGVGLIKSMQGPDRQSIVNRIFSATNITPDGVARARSQFAKAGKLDDWNAGLSSFLSDKLDQAMKVNASGQRGNVAGKFFANVWGDPRQQNIVKAALGNDPDKIAGFGKFMEVLRRAGSSLSEGAPTATDLNVDRGPVGAVGRAAAAATSAKTYVNPGNAIRDGVSYLRNSPSARQRLANALLSGDYDKSLLLLRNAPSPTSRRAIAAASDILTDLGVTGGGNLSGLRTPRDAAPASTEPTIPGLQ